MKSIIVEDEIVAAQRLLRMLAETNESIENLAIFESVEEIARYLLTNEHPDILFLDIQVADGNSFELFKILDVKSKVIFTTAYSEYAASAFRQNAIDYLLKPIKLEELKEAIIKVKGQSQIGSSTFSGAPSEYKDRFLIKFGSKFTIIKTVDIAYIYSENKIAYFYLKTGGKVASDYKLQDLEEMLDPQLFFRVNRQFIVHIDAVFSMNTYTKARVNLKLVPEFKEDIIVSTEKTPELKEWLQGHNKSL
jgi:two-component system, LytTR family, response regulator LytT